MIISFKLNLIFLLLSLCIISIYFYLNFFTTPLNNYMKKSQTNADWQVFSLDDEFKKNFGQRSLKEYLTLIRTMKFMIDEVEEDDPSLVDFVKSLIVKPTNKPLNLKQNSKLDYSQFNQSIKVNSFLNNMKNGFFVESGAYDGEDMSNSLFFELNFNWTGLLIEPLPSFFKEMLKKNRNVYALNACIAKKKPIIAKFRVLYALSGRESQMGREHKKILDESAQNDDLKYQIAYLPCFSINTIMKALNKSRIDFFSLDIEGGEWDVVQSIDFQKLDIKTFCIEWTANEKNKKLIIDHLSQNGYNLTEETNIDLFFLK